MGETGVCADGHETPQGIEWGTHIPISVWNADAGLTTTTTNTRRAQGREEGADSRRRLESHVSIFFYDIAPMGDASDFCVILFCLLFVCLFVLDPRASDHQTKRRRRVCAREREQRKEGSAGKKGIAPSQETKKKQDFHPPLMGLVADCCVLLFLLLSFLVARYLHTHISSHNIHIHSMPFPPVRPSPFLGHHAALPPFEDGGAGPAVSACSFQSGAASAATKREAAVSVPSGCGWKGTFLTQSLRAWRWMRNWTAQVMRGKRRTQRRRAGRVKACRCMSKRAVKYLQGAVKGREGGERGRFHGGGDGGGVSQSVSQSVKDMLVHAHIPLSRTHPRSQPASKPAGRQDKGEKRCHSLSRTHPRRTTSQGGKNDMCISLPGAASLGSTRRLGKGACKRSYLAHGMSLPVTASPLRRGI